MPKLSPFRLNFPRIYSGLGNYPEPTNPPKYPSLYQLAEIQPTGALPGPRKMLEIRGRWGKAKYTRAYFERRPKPERQSGPPHKAPSGPRCVACGLGIGELGDPAAGRCWRHRLDRTPPKIYASGKETWNALQ